MGYCESVPADVTAYQDALTGRRVVRWTPDSLLAQHLYFTSPSVTADDRWLAIIGQAVTGGPDLYAIDRREKVMHRLTDNRHGVRKCYCYPYGGPRGLAKPTPCLDAGRNRVYAVIDDQLWRIDLDTGERRMLVALPEGYYAAFMHVRPNGGEVAMPLTRSPAFEAPARTQGEQMSRLGEALDAGQVHCALWLVDAETGAVTVRLEVPFWITHVQYDPTGSGWIMFNSESHWQRQKVVPRIWTVEPAGDPRPLFVQAEGEVCGHENWTADGTIVYHGAVGQREYVAKRDRRGALIEERTTADFQVHHATPDPAGTGYLADALDGLIYHVTPVGADGCRAVPLCRHDTEDKAEQDNHAHVIASPRGDGAVFTAMRGGKRAVYEVELGD